MTGSAWIPIDPARAAQERDHGQLTRENYGWTWAVWLVLGDRGLVYQVTLRLFKDRWTGLCDHAQVLREHEHRPIANSACWHVQAAAAAEAEARSVRIPVPPPTEPSPPRPVGALDGFYD